MSMGASRLTGIAVTLASLVVGCTPKEYLDPDPRLVLDRMDLVRETRIDLSTFEYEMRVHCRSRVHPWTQVAVAMRSRSPATEVLDGRFQCHEVPAGGSVPAADNIVFRQDRSQPFALEKLEWVAAAWGPRGLLEETRVGPHSFELRYQLDLSHSGPDGVPDVGTRAMVVSQADALVVLDGSVRTTLPAGTSVANGTSFSFRADRSLPFPVDGLVWALDFDDPLSGALALTRTLDALGHPLAGVDVEGPAGTGRSDDPSGWITLSNGAGPQQWRFSKTGYHPVWRTALLDPGERLLVPAPRLTPRADPQLVSLLDGGVVTGGEGGIGVTFQAGAFSDDTLAALTALTGQTLPAALPLGWSPLAAFWLDLAEEPGISPTAQIDLAGPLRVGDVSALVKLDETQGVWRVERTLTGTGDSLELDLAGAGAFAVVVADDGAGSPAAPAPGEPLAAGTGAPAPTEGLSATGRVDPAVAAATRDGSAPVALAEVVITAGSPLPSASVLETRVAESYTLRDGSSLVTPGYDAAVVAYQRPGDDDPTTLSLHFPMRPTRSIGTDSLEEARVDVSVRTPEVFAGERFDPTGGSAVAPGVQVTAAAGVLAGSEGVLLRAADPAGFASMAEALGTPVLAFDLDVAGVLPGAALDVSFAAQEPDALFLLARIITVNGRSRLEPLARFESDAAGVLSSLEPTDGSGLPGLTGAGQFVLVRLLAPLGVVTGTARGASGQPSPGVEISLPVAGLATRSDAGGAFRIAAPLGDTEVVLRAPASGDETRVVVSIPEDTGIALLDAATTPSGPRVVTTSPADAATGVDRVAAISVTFSEPVLPATLGAGALVLLDPGGAPVAGSLGLDLSGRVASFLPTDPLLPASEYRIELAASVSDGEGLLIEGPRSFGFRTEPPSGRGVGGMLYSWEPGALAESCANVPGLDEDSDPGECSCSGVPGFDVADGTISCVIGTSGTAEPDAPVILVNDTTGATATVDAGPDGSFKSFIRADVDDFLSAVFVNANGSDIRIPLSRQLFDDGAVGLFESGGILEASNEEAGVVRILVEPGAIDGKSKVRLDTASAGELLNLIQESPPEQGQLLGGFRLSIDGDLPEPPPDVEFPIDPADIDLPPGVSPEEASYALTSPTEIDGVTAYQVIDSLNFELDDEGNPVLASRSFPFFLLAVAAAGGGGAFAGAVLFTPVALAAGPAVTVSGKVYATQFLDPEVQSTALELNGNTPPPGSKPLPGATVTFNTSIQTVGLKGRVRQGALIAITDSRGFYAIKAPVNRFEAAGAALTAKHPLYPGRVAINGFTLDNIFFEAANATFASPGQGSIYSKNLFIPGAGGSNASDGQRPNLSVSHTPLFPPVNTPVELKVLALDNFSQPELEVEFVSVESLVPGVPVGPDDLSLGTPILENPSGQATRATAVYSSTKAARVTLLVKALDQSGNAVEAPHFIDFGGVLPSPGSAEPTDPNDDVGPRVVQVFPTMGSRGLPPGEPIRLRFSDPIPPNQVEGQPDWLQLTGVAADAPSPPGVSLSADGRELVVRVADLLPDNDYVLIVSAPLVDVNGTPFDQDPETPESDDFQLFFRTGEQRDGDLGVEFGGGVVSQGVYAFALERGGALDGSLEVFDLSEPGAPDKVGSLSVPGYPRDLTLIGPYAYALPPESGPVPLPSSADFYSSQELVRTGNLVAVVGGRIQGGDVGSQYLWIADVSDPLAPRRLASLTVSLQPGTVISKVRFDPPNLYYLESQGDFQSVNVVNLQKFIYGANLRQDQFPAMPETRGTFGDDLNADGDFVDPGETLPMPGRLPERFVGWEIAFSPLEFPGTTQRIRDFDARGGLIVVALSGGSVIDSLGQPDPGQPVPPVFRTLIDQGLSLDPAAASLALPVDPKRILLLGSRLIGPPGEERIARLAVVTLPPQASGAPSHVRVVDLTDPLAPGFLPLEGDGIEIPAVHGIVQSATLRDDGRVAIATSNDLLLLELERLVGSPDAGGVPEQDAIVGVVPGAGSGAQSFASSSAGIHLTNLGGKARFSQTAPDIEFVSFPAVAPFDPASQVDASLGALDELVAGMRVERSLQLSRFLGLPGIPSGLDPPASADHYYVLVRAPGSAGEEIQLFLESMNSAAAPLRQKGLLFPPVRAGSEQMVEELKDAPSQGEAPVPTLPAFRLSSDKRSPYYNTYLSRPLALVYEELKPEDLAGLQETLERAILWSGHHVRAGIDPSEEANPVLGPFASRVDGDALETRAGTQRIARALAADYLNGPNPLPARGGLAAPEFMGAVTAHNGAVRSGTEDLFLRGRRMHLSFKRFVDAQGLFEGPFGRGWDFNYNQRLIPLTADVLETGRKVPLVIRGGEEQGDEVAGSGDLLWTNGTGRLFHFRRFEGSQPPDAFEEDPLLQELGWLLKAEVFYLPPPGIFTPLVQFPDGAYAMLHEDGSQTWFGPDGRLTRMYDRYPENRIDLFYDGSGRLSRIRGDNGGHIDLGYYRSQDDCFGSDVECTDEPRAVGKVAFLADHTGRKVRYGYTSDGRLARREGPQVTVAGPDGFTGWPAVSYIESDGQDPSQSAKALLGFQTASDAGTPIVRANQLGQNGRDTVQAAEVPGGMASLQVGQANDAATLAQGDATAIATDASQRTTEYSFDSRGRALGTVTTPAGDEPAAAAFEYNDDGLVTRVTHPLGNVIEYHYDEVAPILRSRGNLVRIRRLPAPGKPGNTLEAVAEYDPRCNFPFRKTDFNAIEYELTLTSDGCNTAVMRVVGEQDFEQFGYNGFGQLESHRALGGITRFYDFYDDTGFVETETIGTDITRYEYQGDSGKRGFPTRVTDPEGIVTELVYDERGLLVSRTRNDTLISEHGHDERGGETVTVRHVGDNETLRIERVLDSLGRLRLHTVEQVEVEGGTQDLVTSYGYDGLGRLQSVETPSGETHVIGYDGFGRMASLVVGGGKHVESREYDANGNLVSETIDGQVFAYGYDGHDRLIEVRDPNGRVETRSLDDGGRLEGVRVQGADDEVLFEASYELNDQGFVEKVHQASSDGPVTTSYAFDPSARKLTQTDPQGAQADYHFAADGKLDRIERPNSVWDVSLDGNGDPLSVVVSEPGRTVSQTQTRDENGFVTDISDAFGESVHFDVNPYGRIASRTDREGGTMSFSYTALGEIESTTTAAGVTTRFEYDGNRELAAIIDGAGNATRYAYDDGGRLETVTHPNGSETVYTYNGEGCPDEVTFPGGVMEENSYAADCILSGRSLSGPEGSVSETRSSDALGRTRTLVRPEEGVSTEYQYDPLGYVRRFIQDQNGFSHQLDQGASNTGFRTSLTLPSGLSISYQRDAAERLTAVLPQDLAPVVDATSFQGDQLVATRSFGGGVLRSEASYDAAGRPLGIRYERADGTAIEDLRLVYDKEGRIVARQFVARGGVAEFYEYDAGGRLSRVDRDTRPEIEGEALRQLLGFGEPLGLPGAWVPGRYGRRFSYTATDVRDQTIDVNPDGLEVPPAVAVFGAPDANLAVTQLDAVSTFPDVRGHLSSLPVVARAVGSAGPLVEATLATDFDVRGQLSAASRLDGCEVEYGYSPTGLLVHRSLSGVTSDCVGANLDLVWDGGNLVEVRSLPDGELLQRFYYGDDGDELLAADLTVGAGLQRFYYVSDVGRSVVALVDESGEIVERMRYSAWGQPEIELPDTEPPRISRVSVDGTTILVEFTEPVLPELAVPDSGLAIGYADLTDLFTISGTPVDVEIPVSFVAQAEGAAHGTTLRFEHPDLPPQVFSITIAAGRLFDAWGNPNPAEGLTLNLNESPAFLGPAPGTTAPERIGRSSVGNPFLFHGQYFDYETGLYYMRARWYEPSSGLFLSQDPRGYGDSQNRYAGFRNDPVNHRDPSGAWSLCSALGARECSTIGQEIKGIAGQYSYRRDGVYGGVAAMAVGLVGSVLDVGTGTAQGLEIASQAKEGPQGLVDIAKAGSLILGDIDVVTGTIGLGRLSGGMLLSAAKQLPGSPARMKAYTTSGWEWTRDLAAQRIFGRSAVDILTDYYGYTLFEARAFTGSVRRHGLVIETRQGTNRTKLARRRQNISAFGYRNKPFGVYAKTGDDGLVRQYWHPHDAKDVEVFTGDIDVYAIRDKSGHPITNDARAKGYFEEINAEVRRTGARDSVPIQHFHQQQAVYSQGGVGKGFTADSRGATAKLDYKTLENIGHPGHTVTIRTDAKGNVLVHRTPGWNVDAGIRKLSDEYRRRGAVTGWGTAFGLPETWFRWKWGS